MACLTLRRSTAIHEAGHAVTALVLGVPFDYVTIIKRGTSLGHIALGDLHRYRVEVGWDAQNLGARLAIVLAAGAEAQRIAGLSTRRASWSGDRESCMRLACGNPERLWTYCGVAAANYLLARWELVEAVAEALLARRLLTQQQVATTAIETCRSRRTGRQHELALHDAMQAA